MAFIFVQIAMRLKILVALVLGSITFLFFSFSSLSTGLKRRITNHIPTEIVEVVSEPNYFAEVPDYIINDSLHYFNEKTIINAKKKVLKKEYLAAKTTAEKQVVLDNASESLFTHLVDSIIPYWYGTPWDYNGISQNPGQGQLACGYFVFTLLRDAGVKLPRVKMSQAASEQAIKSLIPASKIKRYSNKSLTDFVAAMKTRGNGIYVLGLDNHIGFYQVDGDKSWFIHSTVIYPGCVIKEKAETSPALEYSNYRVAGKISDDNSFTKKWLFEEYMSLK